MFSEIDEAVRLAHYNPKWARLAYREISTLRKALGRTAIGIEHHGSTSIPGMVAKPIIDILVRMHNLKLTAPVRKKLKGLSYRYIGRRIGQERLYLIKRGTTNFNLGIVKYDSKIWHDNLNFRDFLRNHSKKADYYGTKKKRILVEGKKRLFEYSDAKAPLIEKFIEQARRWKRQTNLKQSRTKAASCFSD